ncbi:uridine kinase [Luedemannella flava]|uniref:uridine kinase n=1 Tax=Luedemannella flava TaxID=349316 RepID=UPI0031DF5141
MRWSVSTWRQGVPAAASDARGTVLDRVAARVVARSAGRVRVGIDGLTAAGKTSFGHELALRVSALGRPVLRASLDDFKRPWAERHLYDRMSGEGYYRNAFDYDAVVRLLLEPAGPSGSGACVLCAIDPLTQRGHRDVISVAAPDAVLIVDGVFAFRPQLNNHWEVRIWVDVDEATSIRRGTSRDSAREGAAAEALHRDRYLPAERIYLAEVDPLSLVDVIVDNTTFDEPRLLRGG